MADKSQVFIKVLELEHNAWKATAKEQGFTLTDLIRHVMNQHCGLTAQNIPPAKESEPEPPHIVATSKISEPKDKPPNKLKQAINESGIANFGYDRRLNES